MAIATSQITIIDYNDALTLTGFITANKAKTQMYNPDNGAYNPDWSKSPYMVLTPSLYKIGLTDDIITNAAVTSVKWYEYIDGTETQITANTSRTLTGTKNHILTLKTNELGSVAAKDYTCKITYHDPTTELDLEHKISISLSKVINGSGIVDAIALCPNGNVFKNAEVASLAATCDLWRGSVADTTNVSYQWYMQDASVTTDEGGGAGWKKLTDTTGKFTGVTTREITIYPAAITNLGVFKCGCKDTDSTSPTYNSTFWDVVTFIDNTDPIAITILSSGGNIFKNGTGSSTLTAKVYQAGSEIDTDGSTYTYTWLKYKSDGTRDTTFGTSGTKTGKSISVTGSDVDVKATFVCEIS